MDTTRRELVQKTASLAAVYVWHPEPDGAATFATGDGGWILAVNSVALV